MARDPDEEFLRSVLQDHGGAVLAYALRRLGDRAAAEDVLQETLLRAWRHREKLAGRGTGSARAWLLTVARNIVTDRFRAAGARPREVVATDATAPVEGDHADRVVASVSVAAALDMLSAEQRQVVLLLHFERRTLAEAADIIGVPAGTVSSRLFHAKKALAKALTQDDEREGAP